MITDCFRQNIASLIEYNVNITIHGSVSKTNKLQMKIIMKLIFDILVKQPVGCRNWQKSFTGRQIHMYYWSIAGTMCRYWWKTFSTCPSHNPAENISSVTACPQDFFEIVNTTCSWLNCLTTYLSDTTPLLTDSGSDFTYSCDSFFWFDFSRSMVYKIFPYFKSSSLPLRTTTQGSALRWSLSHTSESFDIIAWHLVLILYSKWNDIYMYFE